MITLLFHMFITPFLVIGAIAAVLVLQAITLISSRVRCYSWKQSEE